KVEKVTVRSSTNKDINQPELNKLKAVQCYHIQENISFRKAFDRPATILVFDIETTGFSRQNERIIEFALRDLIGGKNSTFQTLINPEKDVLNAYIHGIRTYMVNKPDVPTYACLFLKALDLLICLLLSLLRKIILILVFLNKDWLVRFRELVPILLQYVRSRQVDGRPVIWVAHNGRRFDVPFMIKEFQRCSVEIPPDWMFVDTLPLARQLVKADGRSPIHFEHYWTQYGNSGCKPHFLISQYHAKLLIILFKLFLFFFNFAGSKLSSFSLKALREHYEIPLDGPAHRAMQDVTTLCYVLQRITFDLKLSVPELMNGAFRASDIIKIPPEKQDGAV
ncbi:unnamed protein product, partial [Musa acuminata subsp. burmannicoides]